MKNNKMMRKQTMMKAMKINSVSYKHFIKKIMGPQYEVTPIVYKLTIEKTKNGGLAVTNMVQDEETKEMRFQYGVIGNSKAIRRLSPSNLRTTTKVAVEEIKDDKVVNYKVKLSPDGRYRFYDSIVMIQFGQGVALDLMTNGFKVAADGTVTINDNTPTDKLYDGEGYEFGAPVWGPSNEKHAAAFMYNAKQRTRDEWYLFSDELTGGAFESIFEQDNTPAYLLKQVTRWGNYMTGSIDGPSIDLTKDYIVIIHDEQAAMEDFDNVPDHINPGNNIQDGGSVTSALLWKDFYESRGYKLSEEDCCKLSPQVRFDIINNKVMDSVEDDESINHRIKAVKALYGDKVKVYGNTDGRCLLVCDTDGAKLLNMDKLEAGNCVLQSVIMAYAKTNTTNTSGQLLDKYTKKDAKRTKEILVEYYKKALEEQALNKIESNFDPNASFNDNMLALMGTDALNFKEVAKGLCEDLFKYGAKAVGKLNVKIPSMYSHAKFDNSYVLSIGEAGFTIYVRYLPKYNNYAIEAFSVDLIEEKADEIAAIEGSTVLSEKAKEELLDELLTCVTIKYPSAGPEEYEIVRYLTRKELQNRIDRLKVSDENRKEIQKYWDRASYGITYYAPINILKHKLAGMDIDYDATAADLSKFKEVLLSDTTRVVDYIDYFDKAYINK